MADTAVSYRGTGKRKTSVARVVLVPGAGAITVNGKPIEQYFPRQTLRAIATAPLQLTGTDSAYDVRARIDGGTEVLDQRAAVDDDLTLAGDQPDAGDRRLAAAGARVGSGGGGHASVLRQASGSGRWA